MRPDLSNLDCNPRSNRSPDADFDTLTREAATSPGPPVVAATRRDEDCLMNQPQPAGDTLRTRAARIRTQDSTKPRQHRGPQQDNGLPDVHVRSLGVIGERIYRLLSTPGIGDPVPGTPTTRDQLRLLRHWLERQTSQHASTHRGRLSGQVLRFLAVPQDHPLAVCGLHIGRLQLLTTLLAEHAETETDRHDNAEGPAA
jgi:hypothetical protein